MDVLAFLASKNHFFDSTPILKDLFKRGGVGRGEHVSVTRAALLRKVRFSESGAEEAVAAPVGAIAR
eukprot:6517262-Karenia_brevis.AAC.1